MEKKVAIVTGASAGIGKEAALRLKDAGWIVYAGARRMNLMAPLTEYGIKSLHLDVSNEQSIKGFIDQVISDCGQIDLLVNNAGYGSYGPFELIPMSEAREQFEVNLFGLANMIQLTLPTMRERRKGMVINVSSIGGSFGEPHGSWYHASKYALEGLSDSLRMELKQFNINVVILKPGAIATEWSDIAQHKMMLGTENTEYSHMLEKHRSMLKKYDGKGSHPSEVAEAILKIASESKPKSRYLVGKGATFMIWARKLLPDSVFDSLMLSLMKA